MIGREIRKLMENLSLTNYGIDQTGISYNQNHGVHRGLNFL